MGSVVVKKGDRRPAVTATAKDAAGVVIDLTGATAKFIMFDWNGLVKVNAAATILAPATDGKLQYDWVAADTDTAGAYRAEFEVTFSDGKKMTVPNADFIHVHVVREGA